MMRDYTALYGVSCAPVCTVDRLKEIHADLKRNEIPAGAWFGPLMVLGRGRWGSGLVTRLAFWLLRKVGWELVSSDD